MKKTFRLPKDFAEKWIEALESGEYRQTEGTLVFSDEDDNHNLDYPIETCAFCCIGVAAIVGGCKIEDIYGDELLDRYIDYYSRFNIPDELLGDSESDNLIAVLSGLNDGLTDRAKASIINTHPNIIFLDNVTPNSYKRLAYTFKEIAEFIKLNVELIK